MPRRGNSKSLTKGQRRRRRRSESQIAAAGGRKRTVKTVAEKPDKRAEL